MLQKAKNFLFGQEIDGENHPIQAVLPDIALKPRKDIDPKAIIEMIAEKRGSKGLLELQKAVHLMLTNGYSPNGLGEKLRGLKVFRNKSNERCREMLTLIEKAGIPPCEEILRVEQLAARISFYWGKKYAREPSRSVAKYIGAESFFNFVRIDSKHKAEPDRLGLYDKDLSLVQSLLADLIRSGILDSDIRLRAKSEWSEEIKITPLEMIMRTTRFAVNASLQAVGDSNPIRSPFHHEGIDVCMIDENNEVLGCGWHVPTIDRYDYTRFCCDIRLTAFSNDAEEKIEKLISGLD